MDREQAIETLQACIRGCVRRESREPRTPFPFARDSDLLTGVLTWLQAQVPTKNNHPVKVPAVPRDSRYVSSYTGMLTRDLDDRDS